MTFESEQQAIDALVAEGNAEPTSSLPELTNTQETTAPVEGATPEDSGNVDQSALDAAEQNAGYLRQQDYTRKTQEIAPLRNFMEQAKVTDLAQLQYAWDLTQQLQSDPRGIYEALGARLGDMGLLQGSNPDVAGQVPEAEEYEEIELPPHIKAQIDKVSVLEQRLAAIDARAAQAELESQISRQEHLVRELNPNYKEEDMNYVHVLSHFTGGNLEDASNLYQNVMQHVLANHIAAKAGVSDSVTPPLSRGHANLAVEPSDSVDDAHAKALEYIANLSD